MLISLLIQTNICFNGEKNIMECEATGSNDFKLNSFNNGFVY